MYTFSPTSGERFYNMPDKDIWFEEKRIEITDDQAPSVTTLLGVWPKGREFMEWLAKQKTYGDAVSARNAGGARGSRVHQHIERIVKGEVLSFHEYKKEFHRDDDMLAYDEWRRLESFKEWHADMGYPTLVNRLTGKPALECTLYSWEFWFAGTTDIIVTGGHFGSARVMVDFKTGKSIYDSFWGQLGAYRRSWMEMGEGEIDAVGVLLFGGIDRKNYLFEMCQDEQELDEHFEDFLAAKRIWNRTNQKSSMRSGVRTWGEIKSCRRVFEVEDMLRLDQPAMDGKFLEEDETPAWAKRPEYKHEHTGTELSTTSLEKKAIIETSVVQKSGEPIPSAKKTITKITIP